MVRPFNPLNPLLHLSLRIVVPIVERVRNAVLQLHKLNMAAVSLSLKVEKADRFIFSLQPHGLRRNRQVCDCWAACPGAPGEKRSSVHADGLTVRG